MLASWKLLLDMPCNLSLNLFHLTRTHVDQSLSRGYTLVYGVVFNGVSKVLVNHPWLLAGFGKLMTATFLANQNTSKLIILSCVGYMVLSPSLKLTIMVKPDDGITVYVEESK